MKILISASEIISHLYCPRFTYFTQALNLSEHEEKRFKVRKGRELHLEKTKINKDYLRKRIRAIDKEIDIYLSSEKLHLKGIVDEILTLQDNSLAPLDYKFAEYKKINYKTHKIQSLVYALLISENYDRPVHKGYIVYTRSANKLIELEFTGRDFHNLNKTIKEILLIIQKGYYPKQTNSKAKCLDCAFKNICV